MTDTHVARNTRAHDKHSGQQKKRFGKGYPRKDDDANAKSVGSRDIDHTKSKTVGPPLPLPTTSRPSSVPPQLNDSVVKVVEILAPMTAAKMSTAMTMMVTEANAVSISSTTKLVSDDADDRKMDVEDFNKIVDKVP